MLFIVGVEHVEDFGAIIVATHQRTWVEGGFDEQMRVAETWITQFAQTFKRRLKHVRKMLIQEFLGFRESLHRVMVVLPLLQIATVKAA